MRGFEQRGKPARIQLPEDCEDGTYIEIKPSMTWEDFEGIPQEEVAGLVSGRNAIALLELNIIDWDFHDETGNKIEVSSDNLRHGLNLSVISLVLEEVFRRNPFVTSSEVSTKSCGQHSKPGKRAKRR